MASTTDFVFKLNLYGFKNSIYLTLRILYLLGKSAMGTMSFQNYDLSFEKKNF